MNTQLTERPMKNPCEELPRSPRVLGRQVVGGPLAATVGLLLISVLTPYRCVAAKSDPTPPSGLRVQREVIVLGGPGDDTETSDLFAFDGALHPLEDLSLETGSFLGVILIDLTDELRSYFEVPAGEGALVTSVVSDSPAALAGLVAGDVITRLDDQVISSSWDLRHGLADHEPEDVVSFEFWRRGTLDHTSLALAARERGRVDLSRMFIDRRSSSPLDAGNSAGDELLMEPHETEGERPPPGQQRAIWMMRGQQGEQIRIEIDGRAIDSAAARIHTLLDQTGRTDVEERLRDLEQRLHGLAEELERCTRDDS